MELFELCANAGEAFHDVESYQSGLQIPFFKNHQRLTPLHLALTHNFDGTSRRVPMIMRAGALLQGLKDYPLGHVECSILK